MYPRAVLIASTFAIAAAGVVGATTARAADVGCPASAGSYAGGTGSSGDPFLISNPGQLQRLRDTPADWNDTVKLTADIDMGGCTWGSTIGNPNIATWVGTFDGDGHIVSGLDISLNDNWGGFIAYLGSGGAIRDFGFTGDVTVTSSGTGSVQVAAGGLVGWTLPSTITRSFATGDVTVNVTATRTGGSATARPTVGGLVGNLQATVTDSYSTGDVSVTSTATVTGSGSASVLAAIGGLAGQAEAIASVIQRSYSTGAVTSSASATGGSSQTTTERVGGSVGVFNGTYASATATVWDTLTSTRANGLGSGTSANITGRTSDQMAAYSTFSTLGWNVADGYDASTVWSMCPTLNGGAPALSKFVAAGTCYFPPTPPPPTPASAPQAAMAIASDASATVSWSPPVSTGSYAISHYKVTSSPGGRVCLVMAPELSCEVSGLSNSTPYTFSVEALTGAGWSPSSDPSNAVIPHAAPRPSIVITGSREGVRIAVSGTSTALGLGGLVTPSTSRALEDFVSRSAIPVANDGTFAWSRRASRSAVWRIYFAANGAKSNTLTLR